MDGGKLLAKVYSGMTDEDLDYVLMATRFYLSHVSPTISIYIHRVSHLQKLSELITRLTRGIIKWVGILVLSFSILAGAYYGARYATNKFRHMHEKKTIASTSLKESLLKINKSFTQGKYIQAKTELERLLGIYPENADIKNLLTQLTKELTFGINFRYLAGDQQNSHEIPRIHSGGRYRFEYRSNE